MIGSVRVSSVAMTDAEAVVRDLMAGVAAERGLKGPVTVEALSSGGANFTSALFAASFDDIKAFAKVATISEAMRSIMNAETLFRTEQIVYNELVAIYDDIIARHDTAKPFRFPKVYATLMEHGRETVVMEDLRAQGYTTPARQDSIDLPFASAAIAKLAAFHALSFAFEKERPEEFAEMAQRLKHKPFQDVSENNESMKTAWENMVKGAVAAADEEHRPKLVKLLTVEIGGFDKFKVPISKTVLAHGDYRASNLMSREQDGRTEVIVLDYQTVHAGCPVSDLLYLLFLGTDHQFRSQHYQHLLGLYHAELSAALDKLGLDVEEVYPRKVFDDEVKQMQPLALIISVAVLPMVMAHEAAAPKFAEGSGDLSEFASIQNELFANRFASLVRDCVHWGVI